MPHGLIVTLSGYSLCEGCFEDEYGYSFTIDGDSVNGEYKGFWDVCQQKLINPSGSYSGTYKVYDNSNCSGSPMDEYHLDKIEIFFPSVTKLGDDWYIRVGVSLDSGGSGVCGVEDTSCLIKSGHCFETASPCSGGWGCGSLIIGGLDCVATGGTYCDRVYTGDVEVGVIGIYCRQQRGA